jgi:hypothetical protein
MLNKKTLLVAATIITLGSSLSYADERFPPIKDETVKKECGDCHMAFQPQMLPQRSWVKIMDTLGDHFGEDASLDKATAEGIKNYLVENASDAGWWSGKFMRGVRDDWVPLRITEIPYWVREHNEEVPNYAWSDPKVKSKANCTACHPRANMGNYDDD